MTSYLETLSISNQDELFRTLSLHLGPNEVDSSHIIYIHGTGANGKTCFIKALMAAYPRKLWVFPYNFLHNYETLSESHKKIANKCLVDPSHPIIVFSEIDETDHVAVNERVKNIAQLIAKYEKNGIEIENEKKKLTKCFIFVSNVALNDNNDSNKILYCHFKNKFATGDEFIVNETIINEIKNKINEIKISQ